MATTYSIFRAPVGRVLGAAVVATLASVALVSVPSAPAVAASAGPAVKAGTTLSLGDAVISPNGRYRLVLQRDGNAVVYAPQNRVLWNSGTGNAGTRSMKVQSDGNVVLYRAGGVALWHTATWAGSGTTLRMQDDGNLVVYRGDGHPLWWSGGDRQPDASGVRVKAGERLRAGGRIASPSGRFVLSMQSDGNAVVYEGRTALWSTGTSRSPGSWLTMQADGNAVVYSPQGRAVWNSATTGAGSRLTLQDDGNLVHYRGDGSAGWSSRFGRPSTGPGALTTELANAVNAARVSRGLSRLPVVGSACQQAHAEWMASTATMRHGGCDNIVGYAGGSDQLVQAWLDSPPHRVLMLAPGNSVMRVGVAHGRMSWGTALWGAIQFG